MTDTDNNTPDEHERLKRYGPLTLESYGRQLRDEADAIIASRGIVTRMTVNVMREVGR
jgi:hypothetical protein